MLYNELDFRRCSCLDFVVFLKEYRIVLAGSYVSSGSAGSFVRAGLEQPRVSSAIQVDFPGLSTGCLWCLMSFLHSDWSALCKLQWLSGFTL